MATPTKISLVNARRKSVWKAVSGIIFAVASICGLHDSAAAVYTVDRYVFTSVGNTTSAEHCLDISVGETFVGQTDNAINTINWGFMAEDPQPKLTSTSTPTPGPSATPTS